MEIIGYIVTKNKVNNILPCIKIVSSFSGIEDKTKPILIIGLEEAKKHASSFSILQKQISDNIFWTFGKREKRTDYEKDIESFQEYVLKSVLNNIKYYYFNILTVGFNKIKRLIHIIMNDNEKIFFFDKKMIYMYYENYILGVSVDILEYVGISKKKIIAMVQKNNKNKLYFNNYQFNYKIKKIIETKKYITPFFISLNIY